jgi:hypothetical protein
MGVSGQIDVPAVLPPRKELPVPLDRRLCGSQSRSGRCVEGRNLSQLPENQLVARLRAY